jgi:hypothetical protein
MNGFRMTKFKKGKKLPNEDHIVRHVPFRNLRRDADGKVLGILPQAFEHREVDDYLSVNWLEYFEGDNKTRLVQTKKSIEAAKVSKTISMSSYLAIGNVGNVNKVCLEASHSKVRISYAPSKNNSAHSGIYNLPKLDQELMATLAEEAFTNYVSVSSLK